MVFRNFFPLPQKQRPARCFWGSTPGAFASIRVQPAGTIIKTARAGMQTACWSSSEIQP